MLSQEKDNSKAQIKHIVVTPAPEDGFPPVFWTALTDDDSKMLERINNGRRFDISFIYAVARRCSNGWPQVVVCRPVTANGTPFPTVFWLTCPYLDRKCGVLESRQKIHDLEIVLSENRSEISKWHHDYANLRKKLMEKEKIKADNMCAVLKSFEIYGVGGINMVSSPCSAKCIHLQTATWLGWRYHPAAKWLANNIGELNCNGCCNAVCAAERR
jgi:hypothetical protein